VPTEPRGEDRVWGEPGLGARDDYVGRRGDQGLRCRNAGRSYASPLL